MYANRRGAGRPDLGGLSNGLLRLTAFDRSFDRSFSDCETRRLD